MHDGYMISKAAALSHMKCFSVLNAVVTFPKFPLYQLYLLISYTLLHVILL